MSRLAEPSLPTVAAQAERREVPSSTSGQSAHVTNIQADTGPFPALLSAEGVTLQYKTADRLVTAAYRISLSVRQAERLVLLGPSGCGKSTLLKAFAGFVHPVEGRVIFDGVDVDRPCPARIVVFQEFDQLLPWKTVRQNVLFALKASATLRGAAASERADEVIGKVGLTGFADAYPHTLSGGMKQRVAIARALAVRPRVLLMDEPFASLDELTRGRMQQELLDLWAESRFTLVFVTHSIAEALRVGTRVAVLSPHPGQLVAEVEAPAGQGPEALRALRQRIEALLLAESTK